MLDNDMYITETVKPFSSYQAFNSGQGITNCKSPSEIFGNLRKYEAHFTENYVTSDKTKFPNIGN